MPKGRITTWVFSTVLALGLALGQPLSADDKIASASLEGFKAVEIPPGQASSDRVIDLILPYVGNHPESMEGRPKLDLSIRKHGSSLIVDLTLGGYLDDSVAGQVYRGIVVPSPKGWELKQLGMKLICYRGVSASGKCL